MSSSFNGKQCLMLLKLALNRIRLHLQKRTEQNQVMRREISGLIKEGKDEQARIRTVQLIHGEYYIEVLSTLQIHCETVATRMEVLQAQQSCPLDMKESVCSIVYAAPFLENSPELIKVRAQFLSKYGAQFPQECVSSCCVNKKVKEGLSRNMPDEALISYYLSNIMEAHNLDEFEALPEATSLPSTSSPAAKPTVSVAPAPAAAASPAPAAPPKAPIIRKGVLKVDVNGNFWVSSPSNSNGGKGTDLIFVPAKFSAGAADGDTVSCQLDARNDGKLSGKIVKVEKSLVASAMPAASPASSTVSNSSPTASFVQISSFDSDPQFRQGIFRIDMSGHSWVGDEDPFVFVAQQGRGDAQHGDFVTVQLHPRGDKKLSGHVVSIIQRAPSRKPLQPAPVEEIDGTLIEFSDEDGGSSPAGSSPSTDMLLEPGGDYFMKNGATIVVPQSLASGGAKIGDFVRVQVVQDLKQARKKIARVSRILKPRDDSFVDAFDVSVKILIDHEGNGHCPNNNTSVLQKLPPGSNFVFVPQSQLGGARHGDMVTVRVNPLRRATNGSLLGSIKSILERNSFDSAASGAALSAYDRAAQMHLFDGDSKKNNSISFDDMVKQAEADASAGMGDELDALSQVWDTGLSGLGISGLSFEPKQLSTVNASPDYIVQKSDHDDAVDRIAAALECGDVSGGGATSITVSLDQVLVIDIGSGVIKIGFSDQTVPTFAVPAVSGKLLESAQSTTMSSSSDLARSGDNILVGQAAMNKKALLQIEHVMDRGVVTNWSIMSRLIRSVIQDSLHARADQHAVLLTESTLNPISNKENFAKIFFRELQVPYLYVAKAAVLALNAAGLTTGLVVDIGHSTTTIVPIYEGFIIQPACQKLDVAGYEISSQLGKLVSDATGINLISTSSQKEIARDMKERYAYVAENPTEERRKYSVAAALKHLQKQYLLPDGTEVTLAQERWQCCECLFDPSRLGLESESGLAHLVRKAVLSCDPDLKNQMLKTIVLAGGTSLLPGLRSRLERELKAMFPDNQIRIVEMTKRHFASWIGGASLASASNFKDLLVSRDKYLKNGPSSLL